MLTQPSGFELQWQQFLNYAYPAIQMIFWLVMIAVAVFAAMQFKRYVDGVVGPAEDKAGEAEKDGEKEAEERVSVEEFVD